MNLRAVALALILSTSALAGCTGGDPDESTNQEIDVAMIMDFLNNSSTDFSQFSSFNNTTTVNHYTNTTILYSGNGSTGAQLFTLTDSKLGDSIINLSSQNDYLILVRDDSYPRLIEGSMNNIHGLDGADVCVSMGSEAESAIIGYFSRNQISLSVTPIADLIQGEYLLSTGQCDVLVGRDFEIYSIHDNLGTTNYWTPSPFATFEDSADVQSEIRFNIEQEFGERLMFISGGAQVSLVGNCVRNCSDEGIQQMFYKNYSISFGGGDYTFFQGPFQPYSTGYSAYSDCSNNISRVIYPPGTTSVPGLFCDVEFNFYVKIYEPINTYNDWNDHYDVEWSEWTYYVHYSIAPVQVEN